MKAICLGCAWCLAWATLTAPMHAAVRYVNVNNATPAPPYTNWTIAATVIQDAIDVALAGDEIVVTNGVYQTGGAAVYGTNRVAVTKPLVLRSVNGPEVTVIRGFQVPDTVLGDVAVRCVYLTNGTALIGFTLATGATRAEYWHGRGGGVWCESAGAVLSNCVLTGNAAVFGGGAFNGTLKNCRIAGNSAGREYIAGSGGGACDSTLISCILDSNFAQHVWNELNSGGDGGGAVSGTLYNCVLTFNAATWRGAATSFANLNNCTLVGNAAEGGTLNNCILTSGAGLEAILNYCCTTWMPTNGVGNITHTPLFVDAATGNFRLQSTSPCINAGRNSQAPTGPDLDGNSRIAGGTVDMGAYEFPSPQSALSYAWLQQYGLPTNGSADFTDPDGDGHNNWQEWRAWTNPTNSMSALRLVTPVASTNGLLIRWQSVSGQRYFLERSTNLDAQLVFAPVASNLVGQAGATVYTDTNAAGDALFFYRIGVRE